MSVYVVTALPNFNLDIEFRELIHEKCVGGAETAHRSLELRHKRQEAVYRAFADRGVFIRESRHVSHRDLQHFLRPQLALLPPMNSENMFPLPRRHFAKPGPSKTSRQAQSAIVFKRQLRSEIQKDFFQDSYLLSKFGNVVISLTQGMLRYLQ